MHLRVLGKAIILKVKKIKLKTLPINQKGEYVGKAGITKDAKRVYFITDTKIKGNQKYYGVLRAERVTSDYDMPYFAWVKPSQIRKVKTVYSSKSIKKKPYFVTSSRAAFWDHPFETTVYSHKKYTSGSYLHQTLYTFAKMKTRHGWYYHMRTAKGKVLGWMSEKYVHVGKYASAISYLTVNEKNKKYIWKNSTQKNSQLAVLMKKQKIQRVIIQNTNNTALVINYKNGLPSNYYHLHSNRTRTAVKAYRNHLKYNNVGNTMYNNQKSRLTVNITTTNRNLETYTKDVYIQASGKVTVDPNVIVGIA